MVLLMAACSGSDMDDAATESTAQMTTLDDGDAAEMSDTAGEQEVAADEKVAADDPAVDADRSMSPDAAASSIVAVRASTGRRIVRTAQLELEVEDSAAAADEVAAIAERAGGFVAETDLQRDREGLVIGSITLRVPAEQLFATVEELDTLAIAVPLRRIDEQDVTAESTDLAARLTNLTTYEVELRELLADVRETTTRPDDLLTVFERIRSVRAEIDQAEARLASLDDQVALSTVRVQLRPAGSAVPVVDPTWSPMETVRAALTTTASALSGIADLTIRLVLTVIPIATLVGLPVAGLVLLAKRLRNHRSTESPSPAA